MNEATIQLRDKGVITLPMSLRRKYSLRLRCVGKVQNDKLKNTNPAGDVREHHGHLGHQVAWQKIKK